MKLLDLLVWVLDPQKYADAAIHDRYLAPLATHSDVMVVVLNHIDTVPADRRIAMVEDVRRLLDQDGLIDVPVIATSARQGDGVAELRSEIARRVADKRSTRHRLDADLRAVAGRLNEENGSGKPRSLAAGRVQAMEEALADAAGVPTVVSAIERSTRMRARQATGWPVVSWLSRLKPDPLRRLHLDLGEAGKQLTSRSRTSIPEATPVQRARVDTEVRALADDVSAGMSRPWADAVRRASVCAGPTSATSSTPRSPAPTSGWRGSRPGQAVRLLQWVLIVAALTGGAWTVALAASGSLGDDSVPAVGASTRRSCCWSAGSWSASSWPCCVGSWSTSPPADRAAAADRRLRAAVHGVTGSSLSRRLRSSSTPFGPSGPGSTRRSSSRPAPSGGGLGRDLLGTVDRRASATW